LVLQRVASIYCPLDNQKGSVFSYCICKVYENGSKGLEKEKKDGQMIAINLKNKIYLAYREDMGKWSKEVQGLIKETKELYREGDE